MWNLLGRQSLSLLMRVSTGPPPDWLPVLLFMAAAVGLPLGIYLFYRGFGLLARKRLIQNMPTSTIRSAAIGEVEISGKAIGPYTILSPLSQTDCYYYKVEASLAGTNGDRDTSRGPSVETLSVPFFLEDDTASVMIDARGSEIDLPCTFDQVVNIYTDGNCIRHFIERRSLPENNLRLVEYCIVDGDPLFVLGTLVENLPSSSSFEPDAPTEPGFLSREAADLQRREILDCLHLPIPTNSPRRVGLASAQRDFNLHPPVVLRKGSGGEPFLISRYRERDVVQTLAAKSILFIWGGPILALASLAYLLFRLALW